jgi:hypothetical protein
MSFLTALSLKAFSEIGRGSAGLRPLAPGATLDLLPPAGML